VVKQLILIPIADKKLPKMFWSVRWAWRGYL